MYKFGHFSRNALWRAFRDFADQKNSGNLQISSFERLLRRRVARGKAAVYEDDINFRKYFLMKFGKFFLEN